MRRTLEPVVRIDHAALWRAIADRVFREPVEPTYRQISALVGCSPKHLTRIKQSARGERPYLLDSDVYLSLCWWLDRKPEEFALVDTPNGPRRPKGAA